MLSPRWALAGIVAAGTVLHTLLGRLVVTPSLFPDEYLYSQLGRSLATTGELKVRGVSAHFLPVLEPILTAPVWFAHDVGTSFRLLQLENAFFISLAAIPVYLIARRLHVGPGLALGLSVLAVSGPPALFAGLFLSEPLAYPLSLAVVAAALAAVALAAAGLAGNRDLAGSRQAGQAGDYAAALRSARAAARWQPWSYVPDQDQGAWYAASGRLPEAAAAYRRAVRTAPSAWSAWFGLAEVTTGREQAGALRRARRLNPESRQIAAFCTDSLANGCKS